MIWVWVVLNFYTEALKVLGKRIGNLADRGKHGTCSLYFALELLCSLYYHTLYRALFARAPGPWHAAALLLLHCCWDGIAFAFRSTKLH